MEGVLNKYGQNELIDTGGKEKLMKINDTKLHEG
jgi:hypothetical protein